MGMCRSCGRKGLFLSLDENGLCRDCRDQSGGEMSEAAVIRWSCLEDSESCAACRALENTTWLPEVPPPASAPLSTCTSPEGCRCVTVTEIAQFGIDEPADVAFLRRLGGVATSQQMAKYEAERDSERYANRQEDDRIHQAGETVTAAWRLEKTDPGRAVTMYRESLAVYKEGMRGPAGSWLPSHIHFTYNRLTMLLEKLGRWDEALKELGDHDGLKLPREGPQAALGAMEKRRERLARKLAR